MEANHFVSSISLDLGLLALSSFMNDANLGQNFRKMFQISMGANNFDFCCI